MGPQRRHDETLSQFRFRYARFCFLNALVFAALFALLLWASPDVLSARWPFIVAFMYIALPTGLGTAAIAGIGFLIAASAARYLERCTHHRPFWERVKHLAALAILVLMVALGFGWGVHGLFIGKTLRASRRGALYVYRSESPELFWFSTLFLIGMGLLSIYCIWKISPKLWRAGSCQ